MDNKYFNELHERFYEVFDGNGGFEGEVYLGKGCDGFFAPLLKDGYTTRYIECGDDLIRVLVEKPKEVGLGADDWYYAEIKKDSFSDTDEITYNCMSDYLDYALKRYGRCKSAEYYEKLMQECLDKAKDDIANNDGFSVKIEVGKRAYDPCDFKCISVRYPNGEFHGMVQVRKNGNMDLSPKKNEIEYGTPLGYMVSYADDNEVIDLVGKVLHELTHPRQDW